MAAVTHKQEHLQRLYDGCTQLELAKIFKKNPQEVGRILRNVPPSMHRKNKPVWTIATAAAHLVTPHVDVEQWIRKLRPNDLPPLLTKEFWNGQLAKQKYELESGDLWPTEDVMLVFHGVFKNLRSGILLFSDAVEAQSDLTPKQRKLINRMADGLLDNLRRTLIDGDFDEGAIGNRRDSSVITAQHKELRQ